VLILYREKIQGGEQMNKIEFEHEMKKNGDTQMTLAIDMGISRTTLNGKINETNGKEFLTSELNFIKKRYRLSDSRFIEIFFAKNVS
jgi:hypothetical protein